MRSEATRNKTTFSNSKEYCITGLEGK